MRPKVSDEIKAKLLAGLYEDLMPDPPSRNQNQSPRLSLAVPTDAQ